MLSDILVYVASVAIIVWGVAHLVKTGPVVAGFEPLTVDNRYVLTMEWILEGVTLCFLGILASAVAITSEPAGPVGLLVYRGTTVMLLVMAGISVFTGARAAALPYKVCPVIFGGAAILFALASLV